MLKPSPKVSKDIYHKFLFYLCETFGKLPSDPFFENMSYFESQWLFHGWIEKYHQEWKFLKDQAIVIGSFINPEQAKSMLGSSAPTAEMSEDDMNKVLEDMQNEPIAQPKDKALNDINLRETRRRRRIIK